MLLLIVVWKTRSPNTSAMAFWTSRDSVVRLSCSVMTAPSSLRFGFGRERIFSTVSSRSSVPSSAK